MCVCEREKELERVRKIDYDSGDRHMGDGVMERGWEENGDGVGRICGFLFSPPQVHR